MPEVPSTVGPMVRSKADDHPTREALPCSSETGRVVLLCRQQAPGLLLLGLAAGTDIA
jgi:hypothetical protein